MNASNRTRLTEPNQQIPLFQQWLQQLHIDFPLLVSLFILGLTGLFVLYSASSQDIDEVQKQGIRLGVGFLIMLFLAQLSPQTLRRWSLPLFALTIIMLVLVILVGVQVKGAQRWLDLYLFRFQPSELMKLVAPMALAWFLAEAAMPPKLGRLAISVVLLSIPVVLVAIEPDLGTSLLIASSGFFVLVSGRATLAHSRRRILTAGIAGMAAVALCVT